MPEYRQLAAIMFTDIVGYTALMGNDEQKAIRLLKKNREIQQPLIEHYGGKFIKEMGDGVLASFNAVSDAINAAIKIQESCTAAQDFQLRIGIHLGEVIFENGDVFGDGVNIASRIQSSAKPGCIYVSESVHQNIINKKEILSRFVREEMLKNVKEATRIYEIFSSSSPTSFSPTPTDQSTKSLGQSIAVLPFVNMSNDPDQEYFSDGMAEEILNSLAHLKDLKVAGRTSSFQFKGKSIDLREVGEKLHVRTVLEGSVRKQGNRLRITAQLINVEDGYHLWSEKYDRNMDDLFAVQDEIALTITEQLKLKLADKEREAITTISTLNTKAYELYHKGKFYINRRGNSILTGLALFKEAIALDPGYALAYAGYASANSMTATYSFFPGKVVAPIVKEAAQTAIRLDPTVCQAYFVLGVHYLSEGNWIESRNHFLKSIELDPKFTDAYSIYGMVLLSFVEGKFEEGEKQGRIAIKLEPLSAIDHADLAWTLLTSGKLEEALEMAKIAIDLDGNSFLAHRLAGLVLLAMHQYDEAIEKFNYLVQTSNRHQHAVNSLIWAHCGRGNMKDAEILMNELKARSISEYIAGAYLGTSAAWMGDFDSAMIYYEQAFHDKDPLLLHAKRDRNVPQSLKEDPRFHNLMDRIGFPK
jgi:adenylate cyclase